MSYLLDALRKAEHERKLGTVPDLETEADGPDTSERALPVWLPWAIGAVIVLNLVALAVVVWRWDAISNGPTGVQTAETGAVIASDPAASGRDSGGGGAPVAADRDDGPDTSPASGQPEGTSDDESAGARDVTTSGPTLDEPPVQAAAEAAAEAEPVPEPTPDTAAPETETGPTPQPERAATAAASESVRPEETGSADDVPPLRALSPEARDQVPSLTLNGHLYSSVPGRSFVLINGSRYHEGERLADGGAVESIDVDGVVINYEGRRFRLSAPN